LAGGPQESLASGLSLFSETFKFANRAILSADFWQFEEISIFGKMKSSTNSAF
jgi:hypothetical protein